MKLIPIMFAVSGVAMATVYHDEAREVFHSPKFERQSSQHTDFNHNEFHSADGHEYATHDEAHGGCRREEGRRGHRPPPPPRRNDSRRDFDDRRPPRQFEDDNRRPPREFDGNDRNRDQRPPRENANENLVDAPAGTVILRGGFETERVDGGRPVALIAGALGVEPQVFRDAFSNVRPARNGSPTAERARQNKEVLMAALGKHGITNERLDTVSNYYRYRPQDGELWPTTPATVKATIKNGQIVGFTITNPGSGYLQPPEILIAGHEDIKVVATIGFSEDFRKNGRLTSVKLVD